MDFTRWFRRALAATATVALLLTTAHAAAPPVNAQAPGYYRLVLDAFEVTVLFDGVLEMHPKQLVTNTTPA